MVNKEFTIQEVLDEANSYLENKSIVKRIGLTEFNKLYQEIINKFPYKFSQIRPWHLITTADKTRYRLPEYAKEIKYAINEDDSIPLVIKNQDDTRLLMDYGSCSGEPMIISLGEYTTTKNDIATIGDTIDIASDDNTDAGTCTISGWNGKEEVTEDITIATGSGTGTSRFTVITSIELSTAMSGTLTFTSAGSVMTSFTIAAGTTSRGTNTEVGYIGSKIRFVSDSTSDVGKIFLSGLLGDEVKEETITLNGTTNVDSSNYYNQITKMYKYADSVGSITITELTASTSLAVLLPKQKRYFTRILNIYPCDDVYNIRFNLIAYNPVFDSTKYLIDLPAYFHLGVFVSGLLYRFFMLEDKYKDMAIVQKKDFDTAISEMQSNENSSYERKFIMSGYEGLRNGNLHYASMNTTPAEAL